MANLKKKIWTNTAKAQLKIIYETHKVKYLQEAKTLKDELLKATRDLHFAGQYQKDDIESEFRRIIVRHYKILYIEENGIVFIARIFDTRQKPNKQNK